MFGNKVNMLTADQAVTLIGDGKTVAVSGFVGCAHPEALTAALERRYLKEGHPRELALVYAAGQGDGADRGLNHLAHEGLVRRVIGGHWGLAPKLGKMALEGAIEAYNLPQGAIAHLFRDVAAGKPGTITHVGLHTFVDPRYEGGKLNSATTEDLVELITIGGKELLLYKGFSMDVAFIRGTTADAYGNITMEKEATTLEMLAMAQAVRNCGGVVIAQVERVLEEGRLNPKEVTIPGILVDAVVIAEPDEHQQTFLEAYNPSYSGEAFQEITKLEPMKWDERKIIARRAAMEIREGNVINLGIGLPEGIGFVTAEKGLDNYTLLLESGPIGGIPARGLSFGASTNPSAILNQPSQFDFIDGGGIDIAFLGMAEADQHGNVNVSKYGSKVTGCGGFINISQNAKKVVICSTFTAGGLELAMENHHLRIVKEGKIKKFVSQVEQITFNAAYTGAKGIELLYVTERAVFQLNGRTLELIEIAPGIDIQEHILAQMSFTPLISPQLTLMDSSIFE
jgi:propionate CoA-transferase